jgi:hypothetical protein
LAAIATATAAVLRSGNSPTKTSPGQLNARTLP